MATFSPDQAVQVVADRVLPAWNLEQIRLARIDRWARWNHDDPWQPRDLPPEHRELAAKAQAPWGMKVIDELTRTLFIEGYRRPDAPEDTTGWDLWQRNALDAGQIPIYRDATTYGLAYGLALPGTDAMTGEPTVVMRGESPLSMIALYDDPAHDEWAQVAMRARKVKNGLNIELFDDQAVHYITLETTGAKPVHRKMVMHGCPVCPVVRFAHRMDLTGRCCGVIEPIIPLLSRIDQTTYDRLMVQRFGAHMVKYITGIDLVAAAKANNTTPDKLKVALKASDILTAADPDTKIGTLEASPLDPFNASKKQDLQEVAAVSSLPAAELMGSDNVPAEGFIAARASQMAWAEESQHTHGESAEQWIRLACHIAGNEEAARDFKAQVRWKDTFIRSIAQVGDAFSKLADPAGVGFPGELLWPKIPGLTDQDIDEAHRIRSEPSPLDALTAALAEANTSQL